MAEFQEVMRQFDRMCKAYAGCVDCPLAIKGSVETKCSIGSFIDESEYVEREVMAWVAEHPEPQYPTWLEWLHDLGLIVQREGTFTEYGPNESFSAIKKVDILTIKGYQSIPADIAQKLGIEPKEG